MLILNIDGRGSYRDQSGVIQVGPSMVGFIPPDDGLLISDNEKPYRHYYCRFQGDYALELAARICDECDGIFFKYDAIQSLVSCLASLPYVIRKNLRDQMDEYDLALARILVSLMRKDRKLESEGISGHALRNYIESHLDELIDLDVMAKYFSVSKQSLCRIAKKQLGDTIVNTSNAIRVDYACQLLRTGSMNVSEISQRVGFDDPFYFSRVFKKVTGLSPKKWQMQL